MPTAAQAYVWFLEIIPKSMCACMYIYLFVFPRPREQTIITGQSSPYTGNRGCIVKMKVWRDFSLVNRGNSPNFNSPISYFYIAQYWLYSKFANFSSTNLLWKAICQTKVLPNFCHLQYYTYAQVSFWSKASFYSVLKTEWSHSPQTLN